MNAFSVIILIMFILGDIKLLLWAKRQKNNHDRENRRQDNHVNHIITLTRSKSPWFPKRRMNEVN
jgi:hypothetical protein